VARKDVVDDMIDKGVFTQSTARQYLKRKLAERGGDQQELRIPTGESPFERADPGQSQVICCKAERVSHTSSLVSFSANEE
jgi:hypothetical protein